MLRTNAHDRTAGYVHRLWWYIGYSDKFLKIKDRRYNRYILYCSLTIHPVVDLPSVLALKTNNLSLEIQSTPVSIQAAKPGRLINQASGCSCIIFSLHMHKCCVCHVPSLAIICQMTLWRTRTWKIEEKDRKNRKRRWVCLIWTNERGKEREKKTYWWCEFRINKLARFSGHTNADIQANFQLHTDLSLNTFVKKNFKTESTTLKLQRKI